MERLLSKYSTDLSILSELRSFAAGRGHPEYFCLDKKYSPSSRVPCVDFSPWLCSKITAKDSEAIATFVWQIVQANPGLATEIKVDPLTASLFIKDIGKDESFFENYWKNKAKQVLSLALDTHLSGGTDQAYKELRCALILILLHNNFNGFIMTTDAPNYLATVMLSHSFSPICIERLMDRGNSFIIKMRKDTPFWKDSPLFSLEQFSDIEPPKNPQFYAFQDKLRKLPLGSRAHFFDILRYSSFGNKPKRKPLEEMTFYDTRKRGLDTKESSEKLIESGLVAPVDDLYGFLQSKTKDEIISVLSAANVDYRKSWNKEKLVKLALEKCEDKIVEISQHVTLGDIASEYNYAARLGIEYIKKMATFYQIWIGFGLGIGNE